MNKIIKACVALVLIFGAIYLLLKNSGSVEREKAESFCKKFSKGDDINSVYQQAPSSDFFRIIFKGPDGRTFESMPKSEVKPQIQAYDSGEINILYRKGNSRDVFICNIEFSSRRITENRVP